MTGTSYVEKNLIRGVVDQTKAASAPWAVVDAACPGGACVA